MNRSLPNIPEEWIKQARLDDETAIERIYTTTFPKAYTIVYYSLGGTNKFKDEAQTITQDSLRKAFEKLDQLKEDNKFAPWMYTILTTLPRLTSEQSNVKTRISRQTRSVNWIMRITEIIMRNLSWMTLLRLVQKLI